MARKFHDLNMDFIDISFKQLYAYIFMEDLAHDILESLNAHTYGISYANNSYRCAQNVYENSHNLK